MTKADEKQNVSIARDLKVCWLAQNTHDDGLADSEIVQRARNFYKRPTADITSTECLTSKMDTIVYYVHNTWSASTLKILTEASYEEIVVDTSQTQSLASLFILITKPERCKEPRLKHEGKGFRGGCYGGVCLRLAKAKCVEPKYGRINGRTLCSLTASKKQELLRVIL